MELTGLSTAAYAFDALVNATTAELAIDEATVDVNVLHRTTLEGSIPLLLAAQILVSNLLSALQELDQRVTALGG